MENTRLLWDAFNLYYRDGMNALDSKDYAMAKKNIYNAANTLLKLAKESTGALKEQRLQRSEELLSLVDKIDDRISGSLVKANTSADDAAKFNISTTSSGKTKNDSKEDVQSFAVTPSEVPDIKLDDVAGLENAKEEIQRLIVKPKKFPELYKKFKKKTNGGMLLYGVPGTGKTMIAQAIANEIDAKFFPIKCSDLVSKYFGDSERKIKALFEEARKYPTSIIFFDEFESLGTKRDTYSTVMKRIVPELLAQIQGFGKSENTLFLIAATNRPWDIDSAFLRPGRFNTQIYVPLPNEDARRVIINKQLNGVPCADDLDINKIVEITDKFNGSDVVEFCDRLKDFPLNRACETGSSETITNQDVVRTAAIVRSSVRADDILNIRKYEESIGKAF